MTVSELESRVTSLEAEVEELRRQLDYTQALAGIKRGLDEADRGLGTPLQQVDEQLRTKYSIPRP